jgi:hypothetical protein
MEPPIGVPPRAPDDNNPFAAPKSPVAIRAEAQIVPPGGLFDRELRAFELLALAVRVFRARPTAFSMMAVVPSLIFNSLAQYGTHLLERGNAIGLAIVIGASILGLPTAIAMVRMADAVVLQREEPALEALQEGLNRLPMAMWTSILTMLIGVVLMLALVVPGIMFLVYVLLAPCAVALRDDEPPLRCSFRLVRGRWFRTAGFFFLVGSPLLLLSIPSMYLRALAKTAALGMVDALNVALAISGGAASALMWIPITLLFLNRDAVHRS